jgi:hypothetical protein
MLASGSPRVFQLSSQHSARQLLMRATADHKRCARADGDQRTYAKRADARIAPLEPVLG